MTYNIVWRDLFDEYTLYVTLENFISCINDLASYL